MLLFLRMRPYTATTVSLIHICLILLAHIHTEKKSCSNYAVEDIPWLKAEIERQSLEKYLSGDYTMGKLDKNGQRINIRIAIERRGTGEFVTFLSGWMARPNGLLQMTTPYGDD